MRWLESSLRLLRRHPFKRRDASAVVDSGASVSVSELKGLLADFGGQSDKAFTAIAKGVSALVSRVTRVGEQTALLDAVLQDRDERRTLSRAYGVYKFSVDLVHASMGVALADHEQLERIEGKLLDACQARQDLNQFSILFRILTVETRMEAARLDAESRGVFETVAHAIDAMGKSISDTASEALGRIEQVVADTRRERGELHSHQLGLHAEAQRSVQRIRSELDSLKAALSPCAKHSAEIGMRIDALKQSVNQAIIGLQGQDIVRQQLEHVAEGFGDMERFGDDRAVRAQAARVQAGQLRAAQDRIQESSRVLSLALAEIVASGAVLESEFQAMEEGAGKALRECHLATLFREETEKLSLIADQSEKSNRRIAELVVRVDEVIQDFSKRVSEQQFAVKIVALNAQIAAARLSQAGGLNRLAQETSRVSDDVGHMTVAMTERLVEAVTLLRGIKEEADRFQEVIMRDKRGLETQSAEVNQMLADFLERIQGGATEVCSDFAAINLEMAALAQGFGLDDSIAETFAPCITFCENVAGECSPAEAGQTYGVAASRYTMQSEVLVHQQALQASGAPAVAPSPATQNSNDNDIELF
ncbi:hypothetical protein [Nibricoccus sp. IMCC34717]|uniref:hypothetical protein n=1 Tax=Nibricoccus sp. IMCC34717 TaxID=3034021 RepID=UPI00384BE778